MSQTLDVANALARHGRVRRLGEDLTVKDVFRQMDRIEAIGLLYDGAGWDAIRISKELDMGTSEVRLGVARARLRASLSDCAPCADQLDGLMTFSADAVDHSMTCAGCKETRRALRTGKLALRDRWRAEAATNRSVTDKPAGGAHRRDRHKPRPRRPAVNIATTAHPRSDSASKAASKPSSRATGSPAGDDVVTPNWARARTDVPDPPTVIRPASLTTPRTAETPQAAKKSGPATEPQAKVARDGQEPDSPRWTPPVTQTSPVTQPPPLEQAPSLPQDNPVLPLRQPTSPVGRVAPRRETTDDQEFPHLDIPDREPSAREPLPEPTRPRPTGPLVSLPDRTPGRRNLAAAQPDRKPVPQRAVSQGRLAQIGTTILATVTAVGAKVVPKLSGRHLVGAIGLLTIFGLGAVVVDSARTGQTPADAAVVPTGEAAPVPPSNDIGTGLTAGSAAQSQSSAANPEPTGIVATPEPPPTNPNDPTLATWQSLSLCEASGNWGMNSGNGFYGGLQFTVESWRMVGGTGLPHEAPAFEQIRRAERLLDLQGWVAWPVCSIRLGLRTAEPGEVLHPAAVPQAQPSDALSPAGPIAVEP